MPMKILFLSFYFEPDLCAGSFRNSPLAYEIAAQAEFLDVEVDIITTLPNRYQTYSADAAKYEQYKNITITRISLPSHINGILDQINSYKAYYNATRKIVNDKKYDLVYASSSRLFTAFLGYQIAKKSRVPLYLDIRDIFVDTIKDVFPNPFIQAVILPLLKYIEKKTFNYATHINLISGGFKDYFKKFKTKNFSEFSNGIDPVFIEAAKINRESHFEKKIILYAGNIGQGQGLHKIIPHAAKQIGPAYKFRIIGDGGAKEKLITALAGIENVEIIPPMRRDMLIEEYQKASFLLIHLNDYDAFKKVLPSKVFELGVFQVPLIAGVNGYSRDFIKKNLPGSILIQPCNSVELVNAIMNYEYQGELDRKEFIKKYKRETINKFMAKSILSYL